MLKINASYSKKVPAEAEYSSQSYHCTIESELPDGLTNQQLQEKIHATFELVRQAVETELHGNHSASEPVAESVAVLIPQQAPAQTQVQMPQQAVPASRNVPQANLQEQTQIQQQNGYPRSYSPASSKQINYLLNLAKRAGWNAQAIINHCQVNRLEEIDKRICSQLIEQFSGRAA